MNARVGKKKLVLIADMIPNEKPQDTYITPWGKVWTHGADVMKTWKKYGFVPPTEYRDDYRFKINRECGEIND